MLTGLLRRISGEFYSPLYYLLSLPGRFTLPGRFYDTKKERNADLLPNLPTYCSADAVAELKARNLDFLPFPKLEQAVEDDVKFLRASKLVPDSITISGWVYEVETGKTRRVV